MTDRKRCWECVRRRLVCDSGRPGCNRCKIASIDCTGYGAKKPVKFLEPGLVLSRPRKNKSGANQNGRINDHAATKRYHKNKADMCLDVDLKVDQELQVGCKALDTGLDRQMAGIVRENLRIDVDDIIEAILYCTFLGLDLMGRFLTIVTNRGQRY